MEEEHFPFTSSYRQYLHIFVGFLCYWSLLFSLSIKLAFQKSSTLTPQTRALCQNVIIATLHGTTTFLLTAYYIFTSTSTIESPLSSFQTYICLHSITYFIAHLASMQICGILDRKMVIHHTISFIAVAYPLFSGYGGYICLKGLLFADITNFPMNVRILLKQNKLRYTGCYQLLDTAYLLLYLLFRLVLSPFKIFYPALIAHNVPLFMTAMFFGIFLQSVFFSGTMLSILEKKIKLYRKIILFSRQGDKNVENYRLWWFSVNPKAEEIMQNQAKGEKAIF